MSRFRVNAGMVVGALAERLGESLPGTEKDPIIRPTNMQPEYAPPPIKYRGCNSAGCRTFSTCICDCKSCKRWCIYRHAKISVTDKDVINIHNDKGKLITFMTRAEFEQVRHLWERCGVKLVEKDKSDGEASSD